MTKKIFWWGLSLLTLATLVFIIVYKPLVQPKTINIGVILPLTGKLSLYAEEAKRGIELALSENKSPIKIIYEDSQSEPKQGINALQKLLTSPMPIIITGGSNISLAISPLANENKILQMAIFTSVNKYTSPNDYTFRLTTRSEVENQILIDWMVAKKLKNVALIYSNDDWGVGHFNFIKQKLQENQINIAAQENFAGSDTDFRTSLIKIKTQNPEAIFLIAQGKAAGLILKQTKELNLNSQFLGVRAIETNELIPIAGQAVEGIIYPYSFDLTSNQPQIENFISAYQEKYHELPTAYAAEGYDAIKIIATNLQKCHLIDTNCLRNLLSQTKNYSGILGNISFDNNGDVLIQYFLKTVRDGQFVKY